ncbi:MAG: Gfo/Idh/MocA family oxidoreductase [Anaerolineae bacterium]|nr:Gfo/Idh/MocA family oxidoreductase [Anaerolineae bacterium]
MARTIGVALIGYQFMGRTHSNAYRQVKYFFDPPLVPEMEVLVGRNLDGVRAAADKLGWKAYATDWHQVLDRDDIGIVDISSPGDTHYPIALAAAEAGKHIFCEKPLANTLDQAVRMAEAAERAGVKAMTNFNYRFVPAVQLAKRLIDEGKIGEIRHYRGVYLQDWIVDPEFPLVWRLRKESAGSGALGDIAAHNIDLARFLVGEIKEVAAADKTFIKERPLPATAEGAWGAAGGAQRGEVTVDDAVIALGRFEGGALATFEATRFAPGRRNYNAFEISGSRGSISFNLERMNELEYFSLDDPPYAQGFRTINVSGGDFGEYAAAWWPPGHIIGYEHTFVHSIFEFLRAIGEDRQPVPNFREGARTQAVLDAVAMAAASRKWEAVPQV